MRGPRNNSGLAERGAPADCPEQGRASIDRNMVIGPYPRRYIPSLTPPMLTKLQLRWTAFQRSEFLAGLRVKSTQRLGPPKETPAPRSD